MTPTETMMTLAGDSIRFASLERRRKTVKSRIDSGILVGWGGGVFPLPPPGSTSAFVASLLSPRASSLFPSLDIFGRDENGFAQERPNWLDPVEVRL